MPCQPSPAAYLQPLLDQVMIVVALGVDRNRPARAMFQNCQRIAVGTVIDPQHDHRLHGGPQRAGVGTAFGVLREPIHVAVRPRREKVAEMYCCVGNSIGRRDADAIESKRARLLLERVFESVIHGFEIRSATVRSHLFQFSREA